MGYKHKLIFCFMPLISIGSIWLLGIQKNFDTVNIVKACIFSFLLTMMIGLYLYLHEDILYRIFMVKENGQVSYPLVLLLSGSFLLSFASLLLPSGDLLFWMFSGLFVAVLLDMQLGLLIHFNMLYVVTVYYYRDIETILSLIVIGIITCALATYLKRKTTALYSIIIIISLYITMNFVLHSFSFEDTITIAFASSLGSLFLLLLVVILLYHVIDRKFYIIHQGNVKEVNQDETLEMKESEMTKGDNETSEKDDIQTEDNKNIEGNKEITEDRNQTMTNKLEEMLSPDFELWKRMEEHSTALFEHSLRIAQLSEKAAESIGANSMIAKAGGFFHELGKIMGADYIEEGIKLADQYDFPPEIKDIIKEHNIKYGKPSSIESAIVMLADNIDSTLEYIAKSEKYNNHNIAPENIINQIFQLRLEKGTFDGIILSLSSYQRLSQFFSHELKNYKV